MNSDDSPTRPLKPGNMSGAEECRYRQEMWKYWGKIRRKLKTETGLNTRIISELLGFNCTCIDDIMKLNRDEALAKQGVGIRIWEQIEEFQNKFGKEMLNEEYTTVKQLKATLDTYGDNYIVFINGNPGLELTETLGSGNNCPIPIVCINSFAFKEQTLSCLGKTICGQCQQSKRYLRIKKERSWLVDSITRLLKRKQKAQEFTKSKSNQVVDWNSVDWTLSDAALADEHGVSRQRVHQVRQRYHRRVYAGDMCD